MFTTPCFIRKNTPELIDKLEELGHEGCPNEYISIKTKKDEGNTT